jgi:hypothetical protein
MACVRAEAIKLLDYCPRSPADGGWSRAAGSDEGIAATPDPSLLVWSRPRMALEDLGPFTSLDGPTEFGNFFRSTVVREESSGVRQLSAGLRRVDRWIKAEGNQCESSVIQYSALEAQDSITN